MPVGIVKWTSLRQSAQFFQCPAPVSCVTLPDAPYRSRQTTPSGRLVDFRGGFTSDWDALWQDFYCDWRNMHFNQGIEPPSWVIGDQVLAAGAKGILFKSAITGGANLVIYTNALTG